MTKTIPVVFFILGVSPVSKFYVPTFRNTLFRHYRSWITPTVKMEQAQCSETSAHKIQTPVNHPKEKKYNIRNTAKVRNQKKLFLFNYMTVTWNAYLTYVPEVIQQVKQSL